MYNAKKPSGKKGNQHHGNGIKSVVMSTVPGAYYSRINSNRSTTHHPVWEALKDVLVVKGGHVFVK